MIDEDMLESMEENGDLVRINNKEVYVEDSDYSSRIAKTYLVSGEELDDSILFTDILEGFYDNLD